VKPTVLVVGPTPPPLQGMSVFTRMLVREGALDRAYRVVHLETADRRSMENMGRLDVRNVLLALIHAWCLLVLIGRHRPGVVYIGIAQNRLGYLRDAVFMAIARVAGRRIVIHLHGSAFREFHDRSGLLMRWVIRRTLRWATRVAVLSPRLRWIFHDLVPPDRIRAVAAGVPDPAAASGTGSGSTRSGRGREGGREVVVGYLGLLQRAKGFVTLLEAAASLHREEPGRYRFLLAGDWFSVDERAAAARLLAVVGLEERVELLGQVDGAAKIRFLRSLDLLVFPGQQPEGLPLVVLEAMAAALPVVATPMGAIPDVVLPGRTGELVAPGDDAALAAAIRRLAAKPEVRTRYGAAARRLYLEQYTEEACVERVIRLLATDPVTVGAGAG
jgi:glycosyltransferase involved in cell wall biosynthesis